jgi:hypothetical protein
MRDRESIKQALLADTERVFSDEREGAISAAGFPVGTYAIVVDEKRVFQGIVVKPEYRFVPVEDIVELSAGPV